MRKPTLARVIQKRLVRALAIWALVLVQAQLLWISEQHHHGEEALCPTGAVFASAAQGPIPNASERPVCRACRVVRAIPARLTAGSPVPSPGDAAPMPAAGPRPRIFAPSRRGLLPSDKILPCAALGDAILSLFSESA